MTDKTAPEFLLRLLVNCQQVGPPYRGWDLHVLNQRMKHIEEQDHRFFDNDNFVDQAHELIHRFGQCRITEGWNVTLLGKVAKDARVYLGLPSVHQLNPDIAKMSNAAKKNFPNLFRRFK